MSHRVELAEFSRACERAARSCTPVHFRHQKVWLSDWRDAAERMHYLQIEQIGISDSLQQIIRIRGRLKKPNLSLELIKPDVETLWSEMSAHAAEASHTILDHDRGFDFSFFAIENESYITGSVTVNRHV